MTRPGQFRLRRGGQWDTITRYGDLAATDLVASGDYDYDLAGRLTSLGYEKGLTSLVEYGWSFDAAGRMTEYVNSIDGTVDYTNDDAGQLTGADYDYQDDEAYVYDENGNRETANGSTYATGDSNQLLSDGTYRYLYDDEGNRTLRYVDNLLQGTQGELDAYDTDITEYTWDYRNRLTAVSDFDTYGDYTGDDPDQVVEYAYDYQNRLVRKVLDSDGDGDTDSSTVFVHDRNQIAVQFDKTGTGNAAAADLSHRYLWGQAVDQLLADEQTDDLQTAGDVLWPLTDHLNTVRDLAGYDAQNDETTIANHRVLDAYGKVTDETNAAVDCLFGFTGRLYDADTGSQNNLNRWYDAAVGRWLSEDPIGYDAADMNLYRYVDNNPTALVDPSGMGVPIKTCLSKCNGNYCKNPVYLGLCNTMCGILATVTKPADKCITICLGMGNHPSKKQCAEVCLVIFPN
ncbi:MAG: RHS repeat-associated core domain-containing protein [Planctomycetia bacterium]|nr:RHS repeat-associated core domain-containing protein [Planctomycetia bacterium]